VRTYCKGCLTDAGDADVGGNPSSKFKNHLLTSCSTFRASTAYISEDVQDELKKVASGTAVVRHTIATLMLASCVMRCAWRHSPRPAFLVVGVTQPNALFACRGRLPCCEVPEEACNSAADARPCGQNDCLVEGKLCHILSPPSKSGCHTPEATTFQSHSNGILSAPWRSGATSSLQRWVGC
jgi:hypothetical protein